MDIKQELGPKLAPQTRLLTPSDLDFETASLRWNDACPVTYSTIVDASCEQDIATTIKYANTHSIPFLAFNGTHGLNLSLAKFQNGIGITNTAMKSLTINEEDGGKTAWIRGSWLTGHLRSELYKLGKRTTLGGCDSTGIMGPMLGGGHGLLQGRYGLLADQIVEMRVVLANGEFVTVSEKENKELFWVMRGAGHNFGVVTSVRYKIYDVPKEDVWSFGSMMFSGARLGELVPVFNQMLENQPVEVALWFPQFVKLPEYEEPVIQLKFVYEGPTSSLEAFYAPLQALTPSSIEVKQISYLSASEALNWGFASLSNQKHITLYRFPVGAKYFHYPSMKATYDVFSAGLAVQPMFAYSFVVWEAYSTQAVKAVPDDATAIADRADELLVAAMVVWPPGTGMNATLGPEAEKLGKELRKCMRGDKELHAYVNYAHGDETVEEVYGHHAWRLEKLRRLKREYDPENRFGFYAPIV